MTDILLEITTLNAILHKMTGERHFIQINTMTAILQDNDCHFYHNNYHGRHFTQNTTMTAILLWLLFYYK